MAKIITSQHYLNDDIIAQKSADRDYDVFVSPVFTIDGETYRVILDGHHSLAAALADAVAPVITEYTATQHDAIGLLDDPELFLRAVYMDGDYIDAITRTLVW